MLRARGPFVVFLSLYQLRPISSEGHDVWSIRSAEYKFNGRHDEVHIRLGHGRRECVHVLEGINR